MNTELMEKVSKLIQHYSLFDRKDNSEPKKFFVENEQYFIERHSENALLNEKSFVLAEARIVLSTEENYFVLDTTNPDELKPIYFINKNKLSKIVENKEVILENTSEFDEKILEIEKILEEQVTRQLDSVGDKVKLLAQKTLEENKKISDFINIFVSKYEIKYILYGDNNIAPLFGNSINQLLIDYVEKAKAFFQPNELLMLQEPRIEFEFNPELLALFEVMNSQSRQEIGRLIYINNVVYLNLFKKLVHKAVFGK